MKFLNTAILLALATAITACATPKKNPNQTEVPKTTDVQVQTENMDTEAQTKAAGYTTGWPDASTNAAKELISKYGDPTERTSQSLVWRNIAPFKRITVYKEVYSHRFPLLHQTPVEHVVSYKAPSDRVDDVWRFSGAVTLDRVKGEMSAIGMNEPMNILSMNLANDIMTGKRTPDAARIRFGQESLDYLNGYRNTTTQALNFGPQMNTADVGVTITDKIRWVGEEGNRKPASSSEKKAQNVNLRQAQEE